MKIKEGRVKPDKKRGIANPKKWKFNGFEKKSKKKGSLPDKGKEDVDQKAERKGNNKVKAKDEQGKGGTEGAGRAIPNHSHKTRKGLKKGHF